MTKLLGKAVVVTDDNFEKAWRKFKKKVQASGVMNDLKEREFYEKPTTRRKRRLAAACNRWHKKLREDQLPKKMY